MIKRFILLLVLLSTPFLGKAQKETNKSPLSIKGVLGSRYISTHNRGELADFNALIGQGMLKASYKAKPWLKFSAQFNGVYIPFKDGLLRVDAATGSGPIYEGNLWNDRLMSGNTQFSLPVLNVELEFKSQFLTLGRFTKESPIINPEPWPFPNAMEGVWYENYSAESTSWQLGIIRRIAPRFSGAFEVVGESIGVGATGVDFDGNTAQYRGQIDAGLMLIANVQQQLNEKASMNLWNYFVPNVTNTFIAESKLHLADPAINISGMAIVQNRLGDGGNAVESLTYQRDDLALYLGLRLEKHLEKDVFQMNLSRIGADGRLLLPREWGREPFYTFQRRTRVEGASDVWAIMLKWQRSWVTDKSLYRFFTSIGKNKMPLATDYPRNKYTLPSHVHWDASLRYQPIAGDGKITAEIYLAYRFLAEDIQTNYNVLINRADFFHADIIFNYNF